MLHAIDNKNLFLSSRSEDKPLISHKFWREVAQYHTLEQLDDILNCQDHAIELNVCTIFQIGRGPQGSPGPTCLGESMV